MVVCVVSDQMPFFKQPFHKFGILLGILSDQKESGFYIPFLQSVQESSRAMGAWPVIECDGDLRSLRYHRRTYILHRIRHGFLLFGFLCRLVFILPGMHGYTQQIEQAEGIQQPA